MVSRTLTPQVGQSRSEEIALAHAHCGKLAVLTIILTLALFAAYLTVIGLVVAGALPLIMGFFLNCILAYAFYTPHHEATHGNVSGATAPNILDRIVGSIAALPLTLSFQGFSPSHLQHHAHTNHPDRDPDYFVAGNVSALPVKWLIGLIVIPTLRALPFVGPKLAARLGAAPPSNEHLRSSAALMRRFEQLCLLALLTAFLVGWGWHVLLLWLLPGRLAGLILMIVFQWLPHHPHDETSRYKNTRIGRFPLSATLLLFQDHHLIHHLYPRVPWYAYRHLFRQVRLRLEDQGAAIDWPQEAPIAR